MIHLAQKMLSKNQRKRDVLKNKVRTAFTILRILSDIAIVVVSFTIGYALKFKLYLLGISTYYIPTAQLEAYLNVSTMSYIIALWLLAFIVNGMYRTYSGPMGRMNEFYAIVKAVALGTFELMAFTYISRMIPDSRFVLVYSAIVAIILLSITRNLLSSVQNMLHRRGYGNRQTLIIGAGEIAQRIAERLLAYPEMGFNFAGFCAERTPAKIIFPLRKHFKLIGQCQNLKKILATIRIDAIFIADEELSQKKIYEITKFCQDHNLYFRVVPSQYQRTVKVDTLDAIPLLAFQPLTFGLFKRVLKRAFDLLLVIPGLLCALPLMGLVAILVKSTSPGPVLFRQTRMTEAGREFALLKFRSMHHNVEKGKPVLSTKDQKDRTTTIGNFLRKSSLDELPQLFNVLKGDMSIIGPRPERPFFHEKYKKEIPYWEDRLLVKAGITGWAQLNGRAELSALPHEKLNYDLYYIEHWSPLFDLKIILRTILHVILQKDAY